LKDYQKNFKKEMKKGLKNLKRRDEEAYYKYITQNHLDNPELRSKYEIKEKLKNIFKKIFSIIIAIIIIGIIIPFAYNKILNPNDKTNIIDLNSSTISNNANKNIVSAQPNKQQEIVNFLNTIRPYQDNISNDIKKKNNDVEQINNKTLTINKYIENIHTHDEFTKNNMIEISNINAPVELSNYIKLINEGYELLCDAYENESIYLKTSQQKYKESADSEYKLSNEKLNSSTTELFKVLDNNNIKHK